MVVALLALLAIGSFPVTAQVPNDTSVKVYLELLSIADCRFAED